MYTQLLLPIEIVSEYREDNFVVSDCNKDAFEWLKIWPYNGANNFTCIIGDNGSGKTHLSSIWSFNNGASIISLSDFVFDSFVDFVRGNSIKMLVIDDIDKVCDDVLLFCIFNFVKENGCFLLSTAKTMPCDWNIKLPDALTRMSTMHIISIKNPGDAIESIISKMLENRGIQAKESIVSYIANMINRDYKSINKIVHLIAKNLPRYGRFSAAFVKDMINIINLQ